jgi:hypothetical protein
MVFSGSLCITLSPAHKANEKSRDSFTAPTRLRPKGNLGVPIGLK